MQPSIPDSFATPGPPWSVGVLVPLSLLACAVGIVALVWFGGTRQRFWGPDAVLLFKASTWVTAAVIVLRLAVSHTASQFVEIPAGAWNDAGSGVGTLVQGSGQPVLGRLRARQTLPQPAEWVGRAPEIHDGLLIQSLSSQRFATVDAAEQQITAEVVAQVLHDFHATFPYRGPWTVPISMIEEYAARQVVAEVLEKDFGNGAPEKMYRVHVQLGLGPNLREKLSQAWQAQIVESRLLALAKLFGLATLMLATAAVYFRLDAATSGRRRGVLQVAAASVLAGCAILVA